MITHTKNQANMGTQRETQHDNAHRGVKDFTDGLVAEAAFEPGCIVLIVSFVSRSDLVGRRGIVQTFCLDQVDT